MLNDLLLKPSEVVSEFAINAPVCVVLPAGFTALNQFEYPEETVGDSNNLGTESGFCKIPNPSSSCLKVVLPYPVLNPKVILLRTLRNAPLPWRFI